jgi:hypothetical protein
MRVQVIAAAAAVAVFAAGAANAAIFNVSATLTGPGENPPNTTTGTGTVSAKLDTDLKSFSYNVAYSGLTGPAVAAHFHGPAAPGKNAPPIITMTNPASPIQGTATLTDAQIASLRAGQWYFNVHTAAHPGGEIRGQLTVTPAN